MACGPLSSLSCCWAHCSVVVLGRLQKPTGATSGIQWHRLTVGPSRLRHFLVRLTFDSLSFYTGPEVAFLWPVRYFILHVRQFF